MARKTNTTHKRGGISHREESRRTGGVLKDEVDRLAAAVLTIINSNETPDDLYHKVTQWLCDAGQIRDSEGESLLDRWSRAPETVAACLEWAREADHKKSLAEEIVGKVNNYAGKGAANNG